MHRRDFPRLIPSAILVAVLMGAMAGCSAPREQPVLQFLEGGGMDWMQEQANQTGVRLELAGLHAIDERTAFVFGRLSVPAGTLRSVLLRTVDGGETWRETMMPITGSVLHLVTFANDELGWAIARWTVEGPGSPVLYRSDDGGSDWMKLTDIYGPPSTHSLARSMTFADELNGEILMTYWTFEGEPAGAAIVTTADGGSTWQSGHRMDADEIPDEMQRLHTSTGRDGSVWELDLGALREPHILIRRGRPSLTDWITEATLPTLFSYKDGRVQTAIEL